MKEWDGGCQRLRGEVGFSDGSDGKGSACNVAGFDPWVGTIPWRREWLPIPVFLPGEFHGQRSLAGYSPWGHRVGHDWVTKIFTFKGGAVNGELLINGHAVLIKQGEVSSGDLI